MKMYSLMGLRFRASFVLLRELQLSELLRLRVTCEVILSSFRDLLTVLVNRFTDLIIYHKL